MAESRKKHLSLRAEVDKELQRLAEVMGPWERPAVRHCDHSGSPNSNLAGGAFAREHELQLTPAEQPAALAQRLSSPEARSGHDGRSGPVTPRRSSRQPSCFSPSSRSPATGGRSPHSMWSQRPMSPKDHIRDVQGSPTPKASPQRPALSFP
ncbi:unnamed protein product [Polarella glacialis]|uniref:Uncharacterized protein n=1 Tax=Polarella glacialis TaxID=89957 RepID=A0A813EF86_POLGL|nr:unnamed protein product [Polarella glacialis]